MKILHKIIKKKGVRPQIIKSAEECSELSAVLCKYFNSYSESIENITDEIADVEIMLKQLKIIFDNTKEVAERKRYKLKRLWGEL